MSFLRFLPQVARVSTLSMRIGRHRLPLRPASCHFSSSDNKKTKNRPDPFARRPTAKCDPYGQGGKPLAIWEAQTLLATIDPQWKLLEEDDASHQDNDNPPPPRGIVREFVHPDFISGSKFVTKVAAVAELNTHFPSITLERKLIPRQKAWQVVTRVHCHTLVLGGLSSHDFHLAMVSFAVCSCGWNWFVSGPF